MEKETPEYLEKLIEQAREAFATETIQNFRVEKYSPKGLIVRSMGLFGFMPNSKFAWRYPELDFFEVVKPHIVGLILKGKISRVNEEPFGMYLEAAGNEFEEAPLSINQKFKGIVLGQKHYAYFVDIGIHFHWKYGSIVKLLPMKVLEEVDENGNLVQFTINPGEILDFVYDWNELIDKPFLRIEGIQHNFQSRKNNYPEKDDIVEGVVKSNDDGPMFCELEGGIICKVLKYRNAYTNDYDGKIKTINNLGPGDKIMIEIQYVSIKKMMVSGIFHTMAE